MQNRPSTDSAVVYQATCTNLDITRSVQRKCNDSIDDINGTNKATSHTCWSQKAVRALAPLLALRCAKCASASLFSASAEHTHAVWQVHGAEMVRKAVNHGQMR